ncbi:MAG: CooT family nickel-binding protein [Clostridium sp.]
MCEANVYLRDKEGREELFLERVDKLVPSEKGIVMENIYSERKIIKATIKEMELVAHRIIIEKIN